MALTLVYTKDLNAADLVADLTSSLTPGETIASVAQLGLSPVTTPALSATFTNTTTAFTAATTGGSDGTSYGLSVRVTTNLSRVIDVTMAIMVLSNTAVPYATRNPYAFQNLMGPVSAGEAALGKAIFVVDPSIDASQGYVTWELLDNQGNVYASGNAYDYLITTDSFTQIIEANAVVNVPSTVPPSLTGQSYQLRWMLTLGGSNNPEYSYENVQVTDPTGSVPMGASSAVELGGDPVRMQLVVPRMYPVVTCEAYKGNTRIVDPFTSMNPQRTSAGWMYEALFDTASAPTIWKITLDPYSIIWVYRDSNTVIPNRETGRMFLISPSMIDAMQDLQAFAMKAQTTIERFHDVLFDPVTVLTWLRRGRDIFNSVGGIITDFTMTNATGQVREYWIRCAEVAALRAQFLAEGEKAFNFSGQDVSLEVDRTQYYDSVANSLSQEIERDLTTLKKNLQIKGIISGDGDVAGKLGGPTRGAMGAVGTTVSVISPNWPYTPTPWPRR